jgi:glutamate dehydrogenase/leucine dehydrogenase
LAGAVSAAGSPPIFISWAVVQRILRHAKPHVTKDRYIKAFDPAVLEAIMQWMQATVDVLEKSPAVVQQMN